MAVNNGVKVSRRIATPKFVVRQGLKIGVKVPKGGAQFQAGMRYGAIGVANSSKIQSWDCYPEMRYVMFVNMKLKHRAKRRQFPRAGK